jgi:hypothetical protein
VHRCLLEISPPRRHSGHPSSSAEGKIVCSSGGALFAMRDYLL